MLTLNYYRLIVILSVSHATLIWDNIDIISHMQLDMSLFFHNRLDYSVEMISRNCMNNRFQSFLISHRFDQFWTAQLFYYNQIWETTEWRDVIS